MQTQPRDAASDDEEDQRHDGPDDPFTDLRHGWAMLRPLDENLQRQPHSHHSAARTSSKTVHFVGDLRAQVPYNAAPDEVDEAC